MASSGGQEALQDVLMAGRNVQKSSYSRSIAGIKRPTMWVWLPFGVNKHTNMLLGLAESENKPSNITLWLPVGGQYALQDVLMAGRNVEKSSYSRSIAGIKRPTMWVWLPFGMTKQTNMLLGLAESENKPSNFALWLPVGGSMPYKMSLWLVEMWKNRHILGVLLE